jgi:hypothetical protein
MTRSVNASKANEPGRQNEIAGHRRQIGGVRSFNCEPELRDEIDRILSLRAKFDNLKPTPEYTP